MLQVWFSSDTKEKLDESAYLLRPNGKRAIPVVLTGPRVMDLLVWFAYENAQALSLSTKGLSSEHLYILGSFLYGGHFLCQPCGQIWLVDRNGVIWSAIKESPVFAGVRWFNGSLCDEIEEIGLTANDALHCGQLHELRVQDLVHPPYPIKLSSNPEAVYEDLPPAVLGVDL